MVLIFYYLNFWKIVVNFEGRKKAYAHRISRVNQEVVTATKKVNGKVELECNSLKTKVWHFE